MALATRNRRARQDSFLLHAKNAAERHGYQLDGAQLCASVELDRLYQELIREQRVTLIELVPTLLSALLDYVEQQSTDARPLGHGSSWRS